MASTGGVELYSELQVTGIAVYWCTGMYDCTAFAVARIYLFLFVNKCNVPGSEGFSMPHL